MDAWWLVCCTPIDSKRSELLYQYNKSDHRAMAAWQFVLLTESPRENILSRTIPMKETRTCSVRWIISGRQSSCVTIALSEWPNPSRGSWSSGRTRDFARLRVQRQDWARLADTPPSSRSPVICVCVVTGLGYKTTSNVLIGLACVPLSLLWTFKVYLSQRSVLSHAPTVCSLGGYLCRML